MKLSTQFKKSTLLILFIFFLMIALIVLFKGFLYGRAVINVTGSYNPITDKSFINNKRVFPSGEGGSTFEATINKGENIFKIYGPYIKTLSVPVKAEPFRTVTKTLELENLSFEEIIKTDDKSKDKQLNGHEIFEDNNGIWLVGFKNSTATEDPYFVLFVYDKSGENWQHVSSGIKVEIPITINIEAPSQLIDYLEEFSGE